MTKEIKHTPAPWVISNDSSAYMDGIIVTDKNGENNEVAGVWEVSDARLIASAPELLEALKMIARDTDNVEIMDIAQTAIAKAEGKQ